MGFGALVVVGLIFLALRQFWLWLWYWRINEITMTLNAILYELQLQRQAAETARQAAPSARRGTTIGSILGKE